MHDFNDLAVFAAVVENGSFTAAARALGIAKSQASHRVARLEERLDLRLIQRTTRKLKVTEVGERYYRHCRAILVEAEHAQRVADQAHDAPSGHVRACCPALLGELFLGPIVAEFMRAFPEVSLTLDAGTRGVDVIGDGYDMIFRVRTRIDDSTMVARSFGLDHQVLVAAPSLLDGRSPKMPAQLAGFPSLAISLPVSARHHVWELSCRGRRKAAVEHHPHLVTDDLLTLKRAAVQGLGLTVLPRFLCAGELGRGQLCEVLPGWQPAAANVHVVYPSRRGLSSAVREFLDFVAPRMEAALKRMQEA